MAGFGDFETELNKLGKQMKALDGIKINFSPSDSISTVASKLKQEIRRKGGLPLDDTTLRELAKDMIAEAKNP